MKHFTCGRNVNNLWPKSNCDRLFNSPKSLPSVCKMDSISLYYLVWDDHTTPLINKMWYAHSWTYSSRSLTASSCALSECPRPLCKEASLAYGRMKGHVKESRNQLTATTNCQIVKSVHLRPTNSTDLDPDINTWVSVDDTWRGTARPTHRITLRNSKLLLKSLSF